MFCQKCGNPDQSPDAFCRQCGMYIPDLLKPTRTIRSPEKHIKINALLSAMTIVTSFTLAILLFSILGFRDNTHPLIYVTAGLLIAMGTWHIFNFWRLLVIKMHFSKNTHLLDESPVKGQQTGDLRNNLGFEELPHDDVSEQTTRHLSEKREHLP